MFNVGAAEELRLNGLRICLSIRLRETRAYHESIAPSQASKASNVAIKATRKALKITLLFLYKDITNSRDASSLFNGCGNLLNSTVPSQSDLVQNMTLCHQASQNV